MKILDNDNHAAMYNDLTNLQNIKANGDKGEALKQAAGQFEAVFLQSVLKHMRQASDALNDEEGALFNSRQQKFYRSMHDSQIAMEMSQQQSLGIADMLVRQLGQHEAFKSQPQLVAINHQEAKNSPVAASPLLVEEALPHCKVARPLWGNSTPLSQQLNIHLGDKEI